MDTAEIRILRACRKHRSEGGFRTPGFWGLRTNVAPGGFHDKALRVPCAVMDLANTKPDPQHPGFSLPIILASGATWEDVLAALIAAGELED